MKSRDQSKENGESSRRDQWKKTTKKKNNERRLGGKALSLESFANAKSMHSGYNPSIIKKQREFYKNAKYVSKFKKSIKREYQAEGHLPAATRHEDVNDQENERRPKANKKKKANLQAIREDVEKKREEAEKAMRERESMIQEKKEERARAEARRKAQREKMFKKTRSGQPVMKYRIQHLLEGILQDSNKNSMMF